MSLVRRLIYKTSDFCIITIKHVVILYSPKLIPYVFFEIKIVRVIGTL